MQNRNTDFLKELFIAHRGLHDSKKGIPENSILAFRKAVENNFIIELDVHILKDGNIVVFHDDNISRLTGINKKLKECTYTEIKDIKLKNSNEKIPLFQDVLKIVNGKVPIIVEIKNDVKGFKLEKKVIEILKKYNGMYAVKSFNPLTVYYLKRKCPEIIRGQLASDFKHDRMNKIQKYILKNMLLNCFTKPDFISYDINALPNKRVEKFRKNNLVLGWTVRNKNDLIRAKKYCDNYIVENIGEICEWKEVKEELNIEIVNPQLINVYSGKDLHFVYPNNDEVYLIVAIYLVKEFNGDLSLDDGEVLETKWFDIDNLAKESLHDPDIIPINDMIKKYKENTNEKLS